MVKITIPALLAVPILAFFSEAPGAWIAACIALVGVIILVCLDQQKTGKTIDSLTEPVSANSHFPRIYKPSRH